MMGASAFVRRGLRERRVVRSPFPLFFHLTKKECVDECLPGFFGPSCTPCSCLNPFSPQCTDGLTGSGLCTPPSNFTSLSSLTQCTCLNGLCSSPTTCSCSAGWTNPSSPPSLQTSLCSTCASGFALSSGGDCLACAPGCSACTASKCLQCAPSLTLSADDPTRCLPAPFLAANSTTSDTFTTCPLGAFRDPTSSSGCSACDPICATCFTAGPNGCLRCAPPRGLLGSTCVDVDGTSGVCNKGQVTGGAFGGTNVQFVMDNGKQECDGTFPLHFFTEPCVLKNEMYSSPPAVYDRGHSQLFRHFHP